jgi:hypothetical protein
MKNNPTSNAELTADTSTDSDAPVHRGALGSQSTISRRLGQALRHLDVPAALVDRILCSNALTLEGCLLSLHPLPEGMQVFASTVALVAELNFLDGHHADSLRFALKMNTLTCLNYNSSITRTEDGMMILLRQLDLQQFDDKALALALQAMAELVIRLNQDFQLEHHVPAAHAPLTTNF